MRSKKALLNLFTNIIREIINILCGFILPYIIISNFGSEIYGLTESIANFLGFIVLLEAGFGPVVKVSLYKALAKKDLNQIAKILKSAERFFRRIAIVFIFYIIGLAAIYPNITNSNYDYIFTASLVIIMAISIFAEYFFGMTYRLLLQSDQKTYITNIIQIVTTLLNLLLIIVAAKFGASIIVIKIITSIVFAIRPLLQSAYVKRKYKIPLSSSKSNYVIEQKWDAFVHHIAFMIHSKTDIAVLTIMSSLKNVAIYSVYALVLNGIKSIMNTVADSFTAAFGDMIAKSEKETLRNSFNSYETIYMTMATIVFSSTIVLITPFIAVYTHNINDTDYFQPAFGVLLTISTYLLTVRQPYNELIKASGHFKQTRKGAITEAVVNIIISIVMVWKFGLIGVALGTLIAMTIRTAEFIYYTNKKILTRNIWINIRKITLVIIETIFIVMFAQLIQADEMSSYINWMIYAIKILAVAIFIVTPTNILLYKKDFSDILMRSKRLFKRK